MSLDELHMILDAASVSLNSMNSKPQVPVAAPTSTTTPSRSMAHQHAEDTQGQKIIDFGKHKGKPFWYAYQDSSYVKWCLDQVNEGSSRSLKELVVYFKNRRSSATALMALDDENAKEEWLLAILDSGCNKTCHGERWMSRYVKAVGSEDHVQKLNNEDSFIKGINGKVKTNGLKRLEIGFALDDGENGVAVGTIDSVELAESEAPLLLSIRDQRKLQLQIELNPNGEDKVYSKLLGGYLQVVSMNGLICIHLLPSHVALLSTRSLEEEVQDESQQVPLAEIPYVHEETNSPTSSTTCSETCESFVPLDEMEPKLMSRGQKKMWKDQVQELDQKDVAMWSTLRGSRKGRSLPRGCKVFLMEVFAGAAVLTSLAVNMGLEVAAPVDLELDGTNLLRPSVRARIEKEIMEKDPYVVTFSPVCGPWGPWSHVNMAKDEKTKAKIEFERAEWYPTLKWMCGIIKQRLKRGRKVLLENPWTSELWETLCVRKLIESELHDNETLELLELIRGDQCEFGLVDKVNGFPNLKPTGFLTASEPVKRQLQRRCSGLHVHQQLVGGKRTKRAQEWPEELCQAMLDGFLEELEGRFSNAAFYNESLQEQTQEEEFHFGTLDAVQDGRDVAPPRVLPAHMDEDELKRQELLEETSISPGEEMAQEQERKAKWLRIPRPTRLALRRLHNMTGHSSTASMIQLLRTAHASGPVLEACRHFACESCRKRQATQRPNTTKMPSKSAFNYELSLDCFEVRDSGGNRHTILSAVCLGTLYHQCWWVAGGGMAKSAVCAEALLNGWFTPFGAPQIITCDKGMHNQGKLKDMMRAFGVRIRYTGVEAPHQLGRGERQGSLFKELMYAAVEERQVRGVAEVKFLIAETCNIKNMKLNHKGFSPYQWVLGRLPMEETSLTSEEADGRFLGVQETVMEPEDEFGMRLQIRQAAKMAFAKVDSSRRVRAALLRKAVPVRGPYVPGDLVCFHRQGRWHGPARVIGREGRSAIWLVHGGVPIVAADTSLRPASSAEIYTKHLLELRPSRKRLREALQERASDEQHIPFSDDYQMPQLEEEDEQPSFVEISGAGPSEVPVPGPLPGIPEEHSPSYSPSILPAEERRPQQEAEQRREVEERPLSGGQEPETEEMPETPLDSPEPPGFAPQLTPLQQAMRRSVDAVDGHPRVSRPPGLERPRSRSPLREASNIPVPSEVADGLFAKEEQRQLHGFLAKLQQKEAPSWSTS